MRRLDVSALGTVSVAPRAGSRLRRQPFERLARGRGRGGDERARHGRGLRRAAPPGPRDGLVEAQRARHRRWRRFGSCEKILGRLKRKWQTKRPSPGTRVSSGKITFNFGLKRRRTRVRLASSGVFEFGPDPPEGDSPAPARPGVRVEGLATSPSPPGASGALAGQWLPNAREKARRGEGGDAPAAMGDGVANRRSESRGAEGAPRPTVPERRVFPRLTAIRSTLGDRHTPRVATSKALRDEPRAGPRGDRRGAEPAAKRLPSASANVLSDRGADHTWP